MRRAARSMVSLSLFAATGSLAHSFPPRRRVSQGPKGELSRTLHPLVTISQEGNVVTVNRVKEHKTANAIHGMERALVNNMVIGVTTGYEKTLTMIGVGYRAALNGKMLTLSLGYSHPVEMEIPTGIKVEVVKNTTIVVSGHDKEQVGQFASDIRSKREPEPYKGKGVRYQDEYVARKEGKRVRISTDVHVSTACPDSLTRATRFVRSPGQVNRSWIDSFGSFGSLDSLDSFARLATTNTCTASSLSIHNGNPIFSSQCFIARRSGTSTRSSTRTSKPGSRRAD
jgi:large subunit ribosomal protein L6